MKLCSFAPAPDELICYWEASLAFRFSLAEVWCSETGFFASQSEMEQISKAYANLPLLLISRCSGSLECRGASTSEAESTHVPLGRCS